MKADGISPKAFLLEPFPLAARYDPPWIRDNALGENALCQAEGIVNLSGRRAEGDRFF